MIEVTLARPWLVARLAQRLRCLSHAPHGAGYRMARTVLWREVRNAELGPGFDAESWLQAELAQATASATAPASARAPVTAEVAMLTSRDIGSWQLATAEVEGVRADCLVTLGLSNAEAVGHRLPWRSAEGGAGYGTINMLVATDAALTRSAQLEALTIAVEARTAAVMELRLTLATGPATGTGTDCTVMACRPGQGRYAGLHTAPGEAIGRATRAAVAAAARDWMLWRLAQPG